MTFTSRLAIAGLVATGCSHWVTERTELPAGACAARRQAEGGVCSPSLIDHAISATVSSPTEQRSEVGASVAYRWQLFEAFLDERRLHRATNPTDPHGYHSLAAGGSFRLSLLALWPAVYRYLDIAPVGGGSLGVMNFDGVLRGRADLFYGAVVEVTAPDLGPLRYFDGGVPALRIGMRRTAYVQEWTSATSLEIGLVWRWGVPTEIHSRTVYKLSLD